MVIFHKEVFKQISPVWKAPFELKVKFYFRNQNQPSAGGSAVWELSFSEQGLSGRLFPARRPEGPGRRHGPMRGGSEEPPVPSLSLRSGREPRLPSCPSGPASHPVLYLETSS